jgi:CBS domain-containing protein
MGYMGLGQSDKSLSEIKVKDIMSKSLISADPMTTIYQIAKLMEKGEVGAILVKQNGSPAGIITDRDFATKIATQKHSLDTPVDKVASYPLQTISSNDSILAAADKMCTKKIRKLAVVEDQKVIGIITSTDIVNRIAKMK